MTAKSISEQIDAIREATARATVSKEAAAEFLSSAGIIQEVESKDLSVSPKSNNWVVRQSAATHHKSTKKAK